MLQKRKSVFFLTMLVVAVVLMFALFAVACTTEPDEGDNEDDDVRVEKDGLIYQKTDEGTYKVQSSDGDITSATILSEVNGIAVTEIDTQAFYERYNLESVVIPEGITEIGMMAFQSCIGLKEVVIPDSVTNIGSQAFNSCENIVRVTLGTGLQSIEGSAFSRCYKLIEVVNKSSLALTIGSSQNGSVAYYAKGIIDNVADTKLTFERDYTIYDDSMIVAYSGSGSSLTIDNGITEIGTYAFADCASLESIVLPDGIEKIYMGAFQNTGLKSITFPSSLNLIGVGAFAYCSALESATFENKNGWYSNGNSGEQPLSSSLWPSDEYVAEMWLVSNPNNNEYIRK